MLRGSDEVQGGAGVVVRDRSRRCEEEAGGAGTGWVRAIAPEQGQRGCTHGG